MTMEKDRLIIIIQEKFLVLKKKDLRHISGRAYRMRRLNNSKLISHLGIAWEKILMFKGKVKNLNKFQTKKYPSKQTSKDTCKGKIIRLASDCNTRSREM